MTQSMCIEQIEGYIRNRGNRTPFVIEDDGDTIEIRVSMSQLVTKEGYNIHPIRIVVVDEPCGVQLMMPNVFHPRAFAVVNDFPKRIGRQSSGLRPCPYTMTAEYDGPTRRLDLKMLVPVAGLSVTQPEFYEAISAFILIADRWAARIQRPPETLCDD